MTEVEQLEEFALRVAERLAHETYKALVAAVVADMNEKLAAWAKVEDITLNEAQCLTKLGRFYPETARAIRNLQDLTLVEGTCRNEVLSKQARDENIAPSARVVCHSPTDRCAGCKHYWGESDTCVYATEDALNFEPPVVLAIGRKYD